MLRNRIIGLETEYGCLVEGPYDSAEVVREVRNWFFEQQRFGLIDLEDRGWDEPAGNGGFLYNGGRVYIDMGHIEYCTPECSTLRDVVRYDRAGDLMLQTAVQELGLEGEVNFIRNNIDHFTDATFGCHENFLLDRCAPLTEKNVLSLLAFQTIRVLFTGAGRIGAVQPIFYDGVRLSSVDNASFQISQRADFIENDFFQWVQHNRAIVNTRDEPLSDPHRFRRLHVLHGDTSVLPSALFLKLGTTSLVLDLLETDALPEIALADAVYTLQSLSRQLEPPWCVGLSNGREDNAVDLLRRYHTAAADAFKGRDEETDQVLMLWENVLDALETDPETLVGTIDWISKRFLLEAFARSEGIDWHHDWLKAQDIEFHHIDPKRSLGLALNGGGDFYTPQDTEGSLSHPPVGSRARVRSHLMRQIQLRGGSYFIDWDRVEILHDRIYLLADPYDISVPTGVAINFKRSLNDTL